MLLTNTFSSSHLSANLAFACNHDVRYAFRNSKLKQKMRLHRLAHVDLSARIFPSLLSCRDCPSLINACIRTPTEFVCSQNERSEGKDMKIEELVLDVRNIFVELQRRQTSISPYDTAWVAMIPSTYNGLCYPRFSQCLSWIIHHQGYDGSWGVTNVILTKDRLCHTLACVIALKKWNTGYENIQKGLRYMDGAIRRLSREDTYTPVGFEIIFPAMLEEARHLGLELPYDLPSIKELLDQWKVTLTRKAHGHMLDYDCFIVEGLSSIVDWRKVLKYQNEDGSIFSSPSATACTFMHTGNDNCLKYLNSMVKTMGDGVPSIYPIIFYSSISMIDRLQRLGLARYFKHEIKNILEELYRSSVQQKKFVKQQSPISDVISSSIAFMLLRLNGYNVSGDIRGSFEHAIEETGQAVSAMLSLFRASQVRYPGEKFLEEAEMFSRKYLARLNEKSNICDKNVIVKDLCGEVEYALKFPLYANLDRIESRKYIDQYGSDDIWIAKTTYKIPCVSNGSFLILAKEDYNKCQAMHQKELQDLQRWYADSKLHLLKFSRQKLTYCFFSAAATLFTPEMSTARIVWTKNAVLTTMVDDFFDVEASTEGIESFYSAVKEWGSGERIDMPENALILFSALYNTLTGIAEDGLAFQGCDISRHLQDIWCRLVHSMRVEAQWTRTKYIPSMHMYMTNAKQSIALEPIVLSALYFVGPKLSEEMIHSSEYSLLMDLLNTCGRLLNDMQGYMRENSQGKLNSVTLYMQENPQASIEDAIEYSRQIIHETREHLLKEVLEQNAIPVECKQVYWSMSKILHLFYSQGDGFSSPTEMLEHINSVLVDPVI